MGFFFGEVCFLFAGFFIVCLNFSLQAIILCAFIYFTSERFKSYILEFACLKKLSLYVLFKNL